MLFPYQDSPSNTLKVHPKELNSSISCQDLVLRALRSRRLPATSALALAAGRRRHGALALGHRRPAERRHRRLLLAVPGRQPLHDWL